MEVKNYIDIFCALLTPTIAILASYIAYNQWKTSEAKRRHELFKYRYENIYLRTINFYKLISIFVYNNQSDKIEEEMVKYQQKFYEFRFYLKESDFVKLKNLFSNFIEDLNSYEILKSKEELSEDEKKEKSRFEFSFGYMIEEKIYKILNKYLRIEKENNIISKFIQKKLDFFKLENHVDLYCLFPTFWRICSQINKKIFNRPKIGRFEDKLHAYIFRMLSKKLF